MKHLFRLQVAAMCGLLFIACSKTDGPLSEDPSGNSPNTPNSPNELADKMVGTYVYDDTYDTTNYYFLGDKNGYCQWEESHNGICRRVFTWSMDGDMLTVSYKADDYYRGIERTYNVSFDNEGNATLLTSDGESLYYSKINNNATTNVRYTEPPFVNYIRIYGIYYKLSSVAMSCDHGSGTDANFKDLMFYGANNSMQPIGARFTYSTPYYEGIDKYWDEGYYNIDSDSGFWTYGGLYCKTSWSSRCDGWLEIEKSNSIMIFNFNLDDGDAIGHFEGSVM